MVGEEQSIAVLNADVWTFNSGGDREEAVLILDGRIKTVGSNALIGDTARSVGVPIFDAGGRTLLPGFVDAHTHLELTACSNEYWMQAHTPPHASLSSMKQSIREQLSDSTYPGWLVVRSSFGMHTKVEEQRLLTRYELDEICPDRPLAVAAGLHVMSLNTVAMQQLGILNQLSTPQMVIHRDGAGEATGVVTEVWDRFPAFSYDELTRALERQIGSIATRFGVTTVGSISYELEDVRAAAALRERGVPLRVRNYIHVPRVASLDDVISTGLDSTRNDVITGLAGVKIFVDGQNGDGLEEEFHDFKWTQEELDAFVARATEARIQLLMHAVSPDAVRMVVTAMERADPAGFNELRHRIEHGGDYLDVVDLERIRRSGAILITTPQFIASAGGERTEIGAPLRTIHESGVRLAAGTDTTGTVPEGASPLFNIACAVNRNGPGQKPLEQESIDVETALRLFTTNAAYAIFAEHELGQLQPGFLGDAVLLDRRLDQSCAPSELFDLRVSALWFEGASIFKQEE